MAFLVLGGYAMRLIEQDFADGLKEEARQMKKQFIEKYPLVNCERQQQKTCGPPVPWSF